MIDIKKCLGEDFNFGFEEMDQPIEIAGVQKTDYNEIAKLNARLRKLAEEQRQRDLEAMEVARHFYAR